MISRLNLKICFNVILTIFVSCKRAPLERFLVEEGMKPAIFGSNSYDPIKQIFELPPPENNTKEIERSGNNKSTTYFIPPHKSSNEPFGNIKNAAHRLIFRKHVSKNTWDPVKASLL